jgi:glycosyltransferase involved in cell wall biosynthesis
MRIGVDLACWTNHRGYGRYTRNLLRALVAVEGRHTYVGFVDAETAASTRFPERLEVVPVAQSQPPARAAADGRRKLMDIWRMSRAVHRAGVDLVFFPSLYSYFPVLGRAHCIVVVHDATPERWPDLVFPHRSARRAWTLKAFVACWQAHRVVTVSHAAARAIRRHLHVSPERLRIVYEAADPVFQPPPGNPDGAERQRQRQQVLARYGIPQVSPLLLYVGGFSPHKNLESLVAALAQLHEADGLDDPPLHLALVGETTQEVFHSCYPAVREQVYRLNLVRHVTFTGYVPDGDLAQLYGAATCLVLPSLDEGFGLPAVEAMACGTPVVASRAGALTELVGDAGLLVAPESVTELVAAIHAVATQPALRVQLRDRGLDRVARLSWARAAAELLDVFEELDRPLEPTRNSDRHA